MAAIGEYQIIERLFHGPLGSVLRARLPGDAADFAIKVFNPAMMGLLEADSATQAFIDRMGMQRGLASRGAQHWAPIHDLQPTSDGAYYVTDYYPLSAQKLIEQKTQIEHIPLLGMMSGVTKGLLELRSRRRRAHANLKPSNVLIAGSIDRLATVHLTDPGTEGSRPEHRAADLVAMGELIHQLVLHRPFHPPLQNQSIAGFDDEDVIAPARPEPKLEWPLPASVSWARLGRAGNKWRDLCNRLLAPNPAGRPETLEEVVDALRGMAPRRSTPGRKLVMAAGVVLAMGGAVGVGGLVVARLNSTGRQELAEADSQWFHAFEQAMRDPARREAYKADPDLRAVVDELDRAQASHLSFDPTAESRYNPVSYQHTRAALATIARIRHDLAPDRWKRLSHVLDYQKLCESRRWDQPALFLARLARAAQPNPGAQVAAGIDRLLRVMPKLDASAVPVQRVWTPLDANLRLLEAKHDKVLTAFADSIRRTAVASVRLDDDGWSTSSDLTVLAQRAEQLAHVVREGFPEQFGRQRFAADIESRLNLVQPRSPDIQDWLAHVDQYALVHLDESSKPVASLRKAMEKLTADVARQPISAAERAPFEPIRAGLAARVRAFDAGLYVRKDVVQETGEVALQWKALQQELDATRKQWVKIEDPHDWVASVDQPLAVTSEQVRRRWQNWTDWLKGQSDALANDPKSFSRMKKTTEDLKATLGALDETFPPVPLGLSESFAASAWDRRERDLSALTQWAVPSTGATTQSAAPDPAAIKLAADQYVAWCGNLKLLAHDFPLTQEILTPADRPDLKWLKRDKAFWLDPIVQRLVKKDVDRIAGVESVSLASREKLIELAAKSDSAEIAIAAWERLGTTGGTAAVSPPWPTRKGELEQELGLRNRANEIVKGVRGTELRDRFTAEIKQQGPVRWRRYVSAADATRLPSAAALRLQFEITPDELKKLEPAPRFNLALYEAHVAAADGAPAAINTAVQELREASSDLRALPDIADLLIKLARIADSEPILARLNAQRPAGALAGPLLRDSVTLPIPKSPYSLKFVRVAPKGLRPFYLCTTETSIGVFIDLVNSNGAWTQANALLGNLEVPVPLHGPQAWARPQSPDAPITRYDTWRFDGGQAFDLDPALRQTRFNRHALAERFGGNPVYEHPMQQVPAQAALYVAGLMNCRLPTPREWLAAYESQPRQTGENDVNLRDQTWRMQHDYTVSNHLPQWPRDGMTGVFWPREVARPTQTNIHPTSDGTLFFKTVDSPAMPESSSAGGSVPPAVPRHGIFPHLVGNVAEFVSDAPDTFDGWAHKGSADGITSYLRTTGDHVFVIGGSALSGPELDVTRPYPVNSTAQPYADVGFRLAFTAPADSIPQRLRWVLDEQQYLPIATVVAASRTEK